MSFLYAGIASGIATVAGVQYVKGKQDAKKAAKARPQYEIPDEIKQNLSQAQVMALEGLPTEQKQQYVNNIRQGTSYGLSQISSRKGGLAGVASLNQNENQGYSNLLAMDAQARRQNLLGLSQQRGIMADYRGQEFQINRSNPYYEKLAQDQARTGALFQNLMSAGGVAAMGAGSQRSAPVQGAGGYQGNPYDNRRAGAFTDPNAGENMFRQEQSQSLQGGFGYGQLNFGQTNYPQGGFPSQGLGGNPSQGLGGNPYPYGDPWQINTQYPYTE